MLDTRPRRFVGTLLITALITVPAACSPDEARGWSISDVEEGLEAIIDEADSGAAVSAGATSEGVFATIVPASGSIDYLLWTFDGEEVLTFDRTSPDEGFPDDESTLETAFPLAQLDVREIVERDPCDREFFTFEQRAASVDLADEAHTMLRTWCSDSPDTFESASYHGYVDGEPVAEIDPTEPEELHRLTDTARAYTDNPEQLSVVSLGYEEHTEQLEFHYATDTESAQRRDGTRSLVDAPCAATYHRTFGVTGQESLRVLDEHWPGSPPVQTTCFAREYFAPQLQPIAPFDADAFDPEVMLTVWDEALADASPADGPNVRLLNDAEAGLFYVAYDGSGFTVYDGDGEEVEP